MPVPRGEHMRDPWGTRARNLASEGLDGMLDFQESGDRMACLAEGPLVWGPKVVYLIKEGCHHEIQCPRSS